MGYVDRGAAERLGAELVDIVFERERDDRDFTRALALEVGASALRLLLPTMTSADREHFERDALATPHQVPEGTINSESRHFPVLLQALRLHAFVIEQVYENAMRSAGVSIDSGMRSRLLDALFPQAAPSHDEVRTPFEGSAQGAASATDASPGSLSNEEAMAGTAEGSPDASSQGATASQTPSPGLLRSEMFTDIDEVLLAATAADLGLGADTVANVRKYLLGDKSVLHEPARRDPKTGLQMPGRHARAAVIMRAVMEYTNRRYPETERTRDSTTKES